MDEISKKARRDLFGSHTTAAAEEAQKRFTSRFHPDNGLVISTQEFILCLRRAFVEGVIWKEEQIE